jgi:hypothetical protein
MRLISIEIQSVREFHEWFHIFAPTYDILENWSTQVTKNDEWKLLSQSAETLLQTES